MSFSPCMCITHGRNVSPDNTVPGSTTRGACLSHVQYALHQDNTTCEIRQKSRLQCDVDAKADLDMRAIVLYCKM